jgi:hypothetical protein
MLLQFLVGKTELDEFVRFCYNNLRQDKLITTNLFIFLQHETFVPLQYCTKSINSTGYVFL